MIDSFYSFIAEDPFRDPDPPIETESYSADSYRK